MIRCWYIWVMVNPGFGVLITAGQKESEGCRIWSAIKDVILDTLV